MLVNARVGVQHELHRWHPLQQLGGPVPGFLVSAEAGGIYKAVRTRKGGKDKSERVFAGRLYN